MKSLELFFSNVLNAIAANKFLNRLRPVAAAIDEFAFGTSKTTKLPHILDSMDIKRFMACVVVALLPAVFASVYFWGLRVLVVILVSYLFGGLAETAFAVIRKKEIHEGFLVTGLIFPLILPPGVPLWIVAVGIVFGVIFGKEVFGGTGRNIFNPAICGRIFLTIAFPRVMTTFSEMPFSDGWGGFFQYRNSVEAVTQATPLALFKTQGVLEPVGHLLLGQTTGCVGETFRIGILAGGLLLIFLRIADWRIPFAYIATAVLFPPLANLIPGAHFAPALFQVLSGGLLLGAFFMATDPVTSPFTKPGRWTAGILLGVLTVLIRGLSGYVEGVMFSILFVNAVSPIIDTFVLYARHRKGMA